MKFAIWSYQLKPVRALNARTEASVRAGCLIRVTDGSVSGYADLHPWTEFGDADLATQLREWRAGKPSALVRRSLELAERDLRARIEGRSLLAGEAVRNNVLVSSAGDWSRLVEQGVRTVKVKCGRDRGAEQELLRSLVEFGGLRVRLDFNSSLSSGAAVLAWLDGAKGLKTIFDYVEDPCPFSLNEWRLVRSRWCVALDHEASAVAGGERPEADVFVFKPARPRLGVGVAQALAWGMDVTVTSMMDHPVGVLHALSFAGELRRDHGERVGDAGCLTISNYEPDEFSRLLSEEGPRLRARSGLGIGFDELLPTLNWETL